MNIIGQQKLLKDINHLMMDDNFPRFSIIQGVEGSGKKLISSYIAKCLNALLVPCELSVDAVREVIELSYEQTSPTVYMWANAHKMSLGAKNAVLKITEEPPQNSYFIMTTDNVNGLLNTLTSRGTVFNINPYSPNDLKEYANIKIPDMKEKELNTIIDISTTPKDILDLASVDISKLNNIVEILCDNIGKVNLANTLKISTFLCFKEDDVDKFDPILFMRACMFRYTNLMKVTKNPVYYKLISLTSVYLSDLMSKSLNKVATIDNWLLDSHLTMEAELS